MLEDFLPLVVKPARYINHEINSVHKDLRSVKTRVCLFFPDTYEVGMSHLGLRILYDILNKREDTVCERVFSPWVDYEKRLRAGNRPLSSLESGLPVAEFDILGVTLQYELSYTNILAGLDLARIPLRSTFRNDAHPVVVAGGPCAVNPAPLADIIDVFFVGEAEEAIHELIEVKQENRSRQEFLYAISEREGFLVPSLGEKTVKRRYLKNLNRAPYPDRPLLPLLKPIHDRVNVEVARGCIRGCRFCQAGIIYRPFRERSPERVKGILEQSLACTGYEEVSLSSLSSGDYSSIQPLVIELLEKYRDGRVSVSLPSLRIGTLTPEIVQAIAATRKTGFTLAPEAGTERLRKVINKPVSDRDLMDTAGTIFVNGWNVLKLYFMIGLPTETDDDLEGIVRLGNELLTLGKKMSKRHLQINISVSNFVPKPHTPFQWVGQIPIEEMRRKHAYLEKRLKRRGISLKVHDPEMSVLEAAFARGERVLGPVIEEAAADGCRFDGWKESFHFPMWIKAFQKKGLDVFSLATRTFDFGDALPWSHVRTGVTDQFLKREYQRAFAAEITGNCREECGYCGIGCKDGGTLSLGKPAPSGPDKSDSPASLPIRHAPAQGITTPVRMKFTKTGRVRFLSHLDLMAVFQRALIRAGVPIAFSQGFNPRPRISFGPALPLGMESESEYADIEIDSLEDVTKIADSLNTTLPDGIKILDARFISRKIPSLSGSISRYVYKADVPGMFSKGLTDRVQTFLARSSVILRKDDRQKDIRPCIETISAKTAGHEKELLITLQDANQVKPRVQDVIEELFNIRSDESALFKVRRTEMYFKHCGEWTNPMYFRGNSA